MDRGAWWAAVHEGSQSRTWRRAWALTASVLAEMRRSTSQVGTAAVVGLWSRSSGEEWVTRRETQHHHSSLPQILAVFVAKSCLTLCNPTDCSPPGSLSMGSPRQQCWSGLPLPPPGDLPGLGIEPESLALQANLLPSGPPQKPWLVLTLCKHGVRL